MEFAKFRIPATTRADNTSLMSGMEINSFFAHTVFAHTVRVSPELRKFVLTATLNTAYPNVIVLKVKS